MKGICSLGMLLARICLSAIFILAGVGKIMDYNGTAAYMASKGMTMIPFFLYAAAAIEIIGGLLVLTGYKARIGAALLLLFLIPTTLIFHDFWAVEAAQQMPQFINFMKNLAIFGGLLYVLCTGPGHCAISSCCHDKCTRP